MTQTAVEWLIDRLYQHEYHIDILDVAKINGYFEQAKEMHKKEIIDARDNMQKSCIELANKINPHLFEFNKKDGEQYYQETYGSKGSDAEKTNSQRFDEFMDLVTSSQTEISDEEIEKEASKIHGVGSMFWEEGAKWCREQIKNRSNG
jgi:hypothetical protein